VDWFEVRTTVIFRASFIPPPHTTAGICGGTRNKLIPAAWQWCDGGSVHLASSVAQAASEGWAATTPAVMSRKDKLLGRELPIHQRDPPHDVRSGGSCGVIA